MTAAAAPHLYAKLASDGEPLYARRYYLFVYEEFADGDFPQVFSVAIVLLYFMGRQCGAFER